MLAGMGLTTDIALSVDAAIDTVDELGSTAIRRTVAQAARLPDGDGAGQARRVYADRVTLAAAATGHLDLYTLGTTPSGGVVKVRALVVRVIAGAITLGGGDWIAGLLTAAAGDGWNVPSAADELQITAGAAGATYEILIVGTGA